MNNRRSMNIFYFLGALLMIIILGLVYLVIVIATKEIGATRIVGLVLGSLVVVLLLLLIILYKTGLMGMPRFMPKRPGARIVQGMSGYTIGMMSDDPKAIDEFISILKTKPELYNQLKEKLT